jgi:hypothetical protein
MVAEVHSRLRDAIEHATAEERLLVILELPPIVVEPVGTRTERIARTESAFRAIAEPVKSVVESLGGEVIDQAWINSTLKCRVSAAALRVLAERDDIKKIDLPHPLSR